jgi:hypothetical protein
MPSIVRSYARFFGVVFTLVALVELLNKSVGDLIVFTPVHNIIHWVVGLLGLIVGFGSGRGAKSYAQVFGIVFAIITILGLFAPDFLATIIGSRVNWFYNALDAVVAIGGLWTGFARKTA